MFCPNCGTNHPDGVRFCSNCGATLAAAQPVTASTPAQPGYANYPCKPANPLNKRDYLKQLATPNAQKANKLILILLAVCVVIMVIGHIKLVHTSIEDIPFIATVAKISDVDMGEVDELKDEVRDELEELEDLIDYYEDELEEEASKKDLKKLDKLLDVMKDMTKSMSFTNLKKFTNLLTDLADSDASKYLNLDDAGGDLKTIRTAMNTAAVLMLVGAIFSLLFTILGGLTRVNVLVVLGGISASIGCANLYGLLFVILMVAAHVGMIIMVSKINKEYKAYRNGTLHA